MNRTNVEGGLPLTAIRFSDHHHPAGTSTGSDGTWRAAVVGSVEGTPGDGGSRSTFQRVVESVIDEFGDDPVKRTKELREMTSTLTEEATPDILHRSPSLPRTV